RRTSRRSSGSGSARVRGAFGGRRRRSEPSVTVRAARGARRAELVARVALLTYPARMRRTSVRTLLLVPALFLLSTCEAPPPTATQQLHATLNQLMQGVVYPAANVLFSTQTEDPAALERPPSKDPAMATDPLVSVFGGWQAIENAALALEESATLLALPCRMCSNGELAPTGAPEWSMFLAELRDVSVQAYAAAQAKDRDKMIDLSNSINDACVHCHQKWRPRRAENRCK